MKPPAIGFCTHLDTVDVNLSPDVHARVIDYGGGDICLNHELDIWLREAEHPEITRYTGQRIIVTDGTSVLGADDKAGIASVMEAAVRLLAADADATGQVGRAAQGAGAGASAHPMNSKGNLVNPILVAHDFITTLDRTQTPEHTEGREGYLWVNGIDGNQATATVDISIRDLAERAAEANPRASVRL